MDRSVFKRVGQRQREDGVSDRVKSISVSAIKEMAILASQTPNVISFAWGIPSFQTPRHIIDAVIDELRGNKDVGKYAPMLGLDELREVVARGIMKETGAKAKKGEILITAGAMEGLLDTILTLVSPGDEVLLNTPGFSSHTEQVLLAHGKPVYIPLIEEENWGIDIEGFKNAISKRTKLLYLCNPSNPTGSLFEKEDLLALADLAVDNDFFILMDEPYSFLVFDDRDYFSLASVPELKERLIICTSLSKKYAMTGFRVGYVYAEESLLAQIMKVHDAAVTSAPTLSQYAAIAALTGPQNCVEGFRKELETRRDMMCKRLDVLEGVFEYNTPEGTYFVFPKIVVEEGADAIKFAVEMLKDAGVAAVPGDSFGPTGGGHLRFCFGVEREDIQGGFDRIERFARSSGWM